VREQLLTELRAETWAALDAAEQVAIHRGTYDLGQEEGHIRARSSKAGDSQELARQGRTLAFRARVNDAREAAEVHAVIADAEVTGDPQAVREVLAAGLARLSTLADGTRVPSVKMQMQ
jgi:hypothetical protein